MCTPHTLILFKNSPLYARPLPLTFQDDFDRQDSYMDISIPTIHLYTHFKMSFLG